MKYVCPVCGYRELPDPPADYEICPSCGTEFGYTDFTRTHEELRAAWRSGGMRWYANWMLAPRDWNPRRQLAAVQRDPVFERNIEAATDNAPSATVRVNNLYYFPLRVA
jgi:hypothetical protein